MDRELGAHVRLVIADDHPLILNGIRYVLAQLPIPTLIDEAKNGQEALRLCRSLNPDLLILDMEMPDFNGIDVTRILQHECPQVRILVISAHNNSRYIEEVLQLGAYGYITKDEMQDMLIEAVCRILDGEKGWFTRQVKTSLSGLVSAGGTDYALLSPREREVLQGIVEGLTNHQIAQKIGISIKTVEKYQGTLYLKLKVCSRVEAAVRAVRNKFALISD